MKFKILTDRLAAYKKGEEVETHEKATNYIALTKLVKQKEAMIVGERSGKVVMKKKMKKVLKPKKK